MAPEPAAGAGHLLVLVHGLWGVPQQREPLGAGLAARLRDAGGGGTQPVVLLSKANALAKSRDGIDACAGRLAEVAVEGIDGLNELVATQLERLEEQQQQSEARLERKLDALSASIEAIGKQLGAGR